MVKAFEFTSKCNRKPLEGYKQGPACCDVHFLKTFTFLNYETDEHAKKLKQCWLPWEEWAAAGQQWKQEMRKPLSLPWAREDDDSGGGLWEEAWIRDDLKVILEVWAWPTGWRVMLFEDGNERTWWDQALRCTLVQVSGHSREKPAFVDSEFFYWLFIVEF